MKSYRSQRNAGPSGEPVSGLGRELEKLAIDSMAIVSLDQVRLRATATGADKLTATQITAAIKATRRARGCSRPSKKSW